MGLSTKEAKNVPPTVYPVKLLGMLFEGSLCKFGPDPKSLAGLIGDTRVLINRKVEVSLKAVERLLGRWVWFLIPTRLALSVLNHLYVFVNTLRESAGNKAKAVLWKGCKKELKTLVGLAPLLTCSWKRPFREELFASDACLSGMGVSVAPLPSELIQSFWNFWRVFPSKDFTFDVLEHLDLPWRDVLSMPVRYESDITDLEAWALFSGVKRLFTLKKSVCDSSVCFLVDNTGVVGAFTKGRAKEHFVLLRVRRTAALCLLGAIRLLVVWVPTKSNPADKPSRVF